MSANPEWLACGSCPPRSRPDAQVDHRTSNKKKADQRDHRDHWSVRSPITEIIDHRSQGSLIAEITDRRDHWSERSLRSQRPLTSLITEIIDHLNHWSERSQRSQRLLITESTQLQYNRNGGARNQPLHVGHSNMSQLGIGITDIKHAVALGQWRIWPLGASSSYPVLLPGSPAPLPRPCHAKQFQPIFV